jgi:hypothetical protein
MTVRARLLALILVLPVAGCTSTPLEPQHDEWAAALARWEVAGIASYTFEFRRLCFCGSDVTRRMHIEVEDGSVLAAVYVDTGEPVSDPAVSPPTIDDLFEEIEDAINRDAFSLIAEYDPELGYPIEVSIDYLEFAIDEEMAFQVFAFEPAD